MKASELIKKLDKLVEKNGDLDVVVFNAYGTGCDSFKNVNLTIEDFEYTCDKFKKVIYIEGF